MTAHDVNAFAAVNLALTKRSQHRLSDREVKPMAGLKLRVRDERRHLEMALKAIDDAEHHAKMFAISDAAKNDESLKEAALSVRVRIKKARKQGRYLWGAWLKTTDLQSGGPPEPAVARRTWC
jgi:hypothetical protein